MICQFLAKKLFKPQTPELNKYLKALFDRKDNPPGGPPDKKITKIISNKLLAKCTIWMQELN